MSLARGRTIVLGVAIAAVLFVVPEARAYQATLTDITDFISQWGGWFAPADLPGDRVNHLWVQTSYAVKTSGNVITMTVTRNGMQKENKLSGQVCSQGAVTTETFTFDARYLATASLGPPNQGPAGVPPLPTLWTVTVPTTNSLPMVRHTSSLAPPACAPPGQRWDATTTQSDLSSLSVEFANQQQAEYLVKLLNSYLPTLSGQYPGEGNAAPTKATGS